MPWPEEYGGRGAGAVEHFIVTEELARARAPELVGRIGINLVGPTLLAHGTPEQKTRWLPEILPARELWCQLFSEPGAGSDLASVTTRAVPTEGGWILDGQKVWTSYAQFADWGLCLARTNPDVPKQQGISTLRRRHARAGRRGAAAAPDHRRVGVQRGLLRRRVRPRRAPLIGPVDEGWRVANSTLTHERGINPRQLVIHIQLLEELLRLALESGAFDDERLRPRLAQAAVEVRLFQLHNWRTLSRVAKGEAPGPEGSALKLYWSEMSKRLHDTVMAVLGPAAPLWRGADRQPRRRHLAAQLALLPGVVDLGRHQRDPAQHPSERVLGLPREPRREPQTTAR